jgi:hypothetical protein
MAGNCKSSGRPLRFGNRREFEHFSTELFGVALDELLDQSGRFIF